MFEYYLLFSSLIGITRPARKCGGWRAVNMTSLNNRQTLTHICFSIAIFCFRGMKIIAHKIDQLFVSGLSD